MICDLAEDDMICDLAEDDYEDEGIKNIDHAEKDLMSPVVFKSANRILMSDDEDDD
jgi:hypothetical protein